MKEYNIKVNFLNSSIESDFLELVQNDYNSTKFNFTFDVDTRIVFKMLYPDGTTMYITDVKDNTLVFGRGILSQEGTYQIELSSYSDDGRLTDYSTMEFYVRQELIATDEVVQPDDRVPILDNLITEVDNINVSATKSDDIATITITKKDGTQQTIQILDGERGPIGITPNIQIGTVTTGDSTAVTISGTIENPLLNFVLEKGDTGKKGDTGEKGDTGDSGVRISTTEPADPDVNVWIDTSSNAGGE